MVTTSNLRQLLVLSIVVLALFTNHASFHAAAGSGSATREGQDVETVGGAAAVSEMGVDEGKNKRSNTSLLVRSRHLPTILPWGAVFRGPPMIPQRP
ncbi:unnamed protein product, partial [Ilex paraguariensis]